MFLILNVVVVYADSSIADDKNKLENVNGKLKDTINQTKEIDKQVKSVSEEINKLDTEINQAQTNLQNVKNQLTTLNLQIETTIVELNTAEESIEGKTDNFNSRIRAMYKNDALGYLEVIFAAEDLKDLLTRLDMVQKIVDYDVELLKFMKEQKELIQQKKIELEGKYSETELMKQKVAIKKQELEVATRSKERLMSNLQQDKKEALKQIDELNHLANKIASDIKKKQLAMQYVGGEMSWPAPSYYRITSPFGWRIHPIYGVKKMHTGMDIAVPLGGKIVAANDGKVQYSGLLGGYGNVIIIDHGDGITTLYAHNSRLLVKEGQWVKKGQAITKAGSTGNSTGPHLHFEVRKNGSYINPLPWVKKK